MILALLRAARRIDEMLKQKVGRPYHVILGVGLIVEIIRRVHEILEAPVTRTRVVLVVAVMLFGVLLLINQLSELSERIDKRGRSAPIEQANRQG
jgi:hypothetical protein